MSLVTKAIPGLFGGVAQRTPAMRHSTQCEVQTNGIATVVDGLYKRPPVNHVKVLDLTNGAASVAASYGVAYAHIIDKGDVGRYGVVLVNGSLMVYNLATGAAMPVTFPDGTGYLATSAPETDFRCVTVADYTFISNKAITVAVDATADAANPIHIQYINITTAVPNVNYSANVNGAGNITIASGAAATCESIAIALRAAIAAVFTSYTVNIVTGTNCIKITKNVTTALTCTVSDGWGNNAMTVLSNGVLEYASLPPVFETGYTVTVAGTTDLSTDNYYVKWNGTKWIETRQPLLTHTFTGTTMPHKLVPDSSTAPTAWVFSKVTDWDTRQVGDESTNPLPSFVGYGIRGLVFFRNRLGLMASDSIVLSRAGRYFGFFSTSSLQTLDTDPIDLAATTEQVESLDWAVPYNDVLLFWANNKQQFTLTAGDVLSPNTARLTPTTTFEAYLGAKPATLGNKILFASTVGSYSQLNLYKAAVDRVTNTAEDVTEHCPTYVASLPREIAASNVTKMAVIIPSGVSNTIPIFKYEMDEKDQLSQKAWAKITLQSTDTIRVMKAHWVSRKLYLLLHVTVAGDAVSGGRFQLKYIDFETTATDTNTTFSIRLDDKVLMTIGAFDGTNTTCTVPYMAANLLTYVKCVNAVEPLLVTQVSATNVTTGNTSTTVVLPGNMTGATIYAGRAYTFTYQFTEVFLRDQNDVPILEAGVKLKRILLKYVGTGWFEALVTSLLRDTYTYPFVGRTTGQPGQGAAQLSFSTGQFAIPVNAKAAGCVVVLQSNSHLPCTFPFAEWVGNIEMKAKR